jgi:hypothetical protein
MFCLGLFSDILTLDGHILGTTIKVDIFIFHSSISRDDAVQLSLEPKQIWQN